MVKYEAFANASMGATSELTFIKYAANSLDSAEVL